MSALDPAPDPNLVLLVDTTAQLLREGEDLDAAARRALDLIAACRRQLAFADLPAELGGLALWRHVTGQRRADRAREALLLYLRAAVNGPRGGAKDDATSARFDKLFGPDGAPMSVQEAEAHRLKFTAWRARRTARQRARAAGRLTKG